VARVKAEPDLLVVVDTLFSGISKEGPLRLRRDSFLTSFIGFFAWRDSREYKRALSASTELILALRSVEISNLAVSGKSNPNPFCEFGHQVDPINLDDVAKGNACQHLLFPQNVQEGDGPQSFGVSRAVKTNAR
jgi:hypothetical protein